MAQIMSTAALVYRTGGDYTAEYVQRLADSIRLYAPEKTEIVCLTNDASISTLVDRVIELDDLPGWWSKLNLFKHLDQAVYFDLDTVIRGDISPLFLYDHRFTMLRDFYHPKFPASGVMAWQGDYSYLHSQWSMGKEPEYKKTGNWGDQGWLADELSVKPELFQELFPETFASYKVGYTSEPVICFHGKPRPHNVGWKV